jgi:hypothetical protein
MKTIIHTCSSSLVRPNGIVRYINSIIDLQNSWGYKTVFVTDAKPTETITANTVIYLNEISTYTPNMRDGHVDLQIDKDVVQQIRMIFDQYQLHADLVVAHDLHSYMAANIYDNGIFVQHESDVLYLNKRFSWMSDEWIQEQISVFENPKNWRIGSVIINPQRSSPRLIYTPPPFTPVTINKPKTRGLLYLGQSREAKGAPEFMRMARALNIQATVITHDIDADLFAGADVYSFDLDQRAEMFDLMSQCQVAYIPSKNECFSLAVLECLQFMPTIIDGQYDWTKYAAMAGATVCTGNDIADTLNYHLTNNTVYNRTALDTYSANSIQYWRNLTA